MVFSVPQFTPPVDAPRPRNTGDFGGGGEVWARPAQERGTHRWGRPTAEERGGRRETALGEQLAQQGGAGAPGAAGQRDLPLHGPPGGAGGQRVLHLGDQVGHLGARQLLRVQRRAGHARQRQQRVQHAAHAPGRLLHGGQKLQRLLQRLARGQGAVGLLQHFGDQWAVGGDVAQRRAQVVRDGAQKLVLCGAQRGQFALAFGQLGADFF